MLLHPTVLLHTTATAHHSATVPTATAPHCATAPHSASVHHCYCTPLILHPTVLLHTTDTAPHCAYAPNNEILRKLVSVVSAWRKRWQDYDQRTTRCGHVSRAHRRASRPALPPRPYIRSASVDCVAMTVAPCLRWVVWYPFWANNGVTCANSDVVSTCAGWSWNGQDISEDKIDMEKTTNRKKKKMSHIYQQIDVL